MVYDFDEGRILGKLNDLEDEIEVLQNVEDNMEILGGVYLAPKTIEIIRRLQSKLTIEKEHLESRLEIHRQKVKESGIKY